MKYAENMFLVVLFVLFAFFFFALFFPSLARSETKVCRKVPNEISDMMMRGELVVHPNETYMRNDGRFIVLYTTDGETRIVIREKDGEQCLYQTEAVRRRMYT